MYGFLCVLFVFTTLLGGQVPHQAMMPAIAEVNCHADDQPDYQTHPGAYGEANHQQDRNGNSEDGH
jgi:hypothetical protein